MEKEKPFAFDWEGLKSGEIIHMKDFPSIRVLKLDNKKACYFGYDEANGVLVDILTYASEIHGDYHAFKVTGDDWHPLTNRLWEK
jgi:hypothetical protein